MRRFTPFVALAAIIGLTACSEEVTEPPVAPEAPGVSQSRILDGPADTHLSLDDPALEGEYLLRSPGTEAGAGEEGAGTPELASAGSGATEVITFTSPTIFLDGTFPSGQAFDEGSYRVKAFWFQPAIGGFLTGHHHTFAGFEDHHFQGDEGRQGYSIRRLDGRPFTLVSIDHRFKRFNQGGTPIEVGTSAPSGFVGSPPVTAGYTEFPSSTNRTVFQTIPITGFENVTEVWITQRGGGHWDNIVLQEAEPANQPPTADAGPDQSVFRTSAAGASVALDGSGSSDDDGSIVTYEWSSGASVIATGVNPTVLLPLGFHNITLTVTDDDGDSDTDEVVVEVKNVPPTAEAGADQVVECSAHGGTTVTLDGSASSDVDGSIVSHEWFDADGNLVATGASPSLSLSLGTHTFTLVVTDDEGATDDDEVSVTVEDTTAPELVFDQLVSELWPPNHQMVHVATVSSSDACDPDPSLSITVTSNEAENGTGDGDTAPDWEVVDNGDGTFDVLVRAERSGNGDGRIYTITAEASDASGNVTTAVGEVTVPHSKGGGKGKGR